MDRSKRRSVPQVMPAPVLWTPYCGAAPAPGEWIARWNLDPVLLAAFVFGIAFYFLRSRQPENRQRYFGIGVAVLARSEEHTSELQSLMRISYAVFCLKK